MALASISLVALVSLGSILTRTDAFDLKVWFPGLEATYHAAWTSGLLSTLPPELHGYLPVTTADPALARTITWGATKLNADGLLVYTSFPPLGFLLPSLILDAIGSSHSPEALARLNALFGLLAALAFGVLGAAVSERSLRAVDRVASFPQSCAIFVSSAIIYIFLPEILISHGPIYWPHSVSQIVLILGVLLALRYFERPTRRWDFVGLLACCILYPALEWTGYLFNAGVFLCLIGLALGNSVDRSFSGSLARSLFRLPALLIAAATMLVAGATFAHFSIGLSPESFMEASTDRFISRSSLSGNINYLAYLSFMLLYGYVLSMGAFLMLGLYSAVFFVLKVRDKVLWLTIFVSTFPLVENMILIQHAWQFSFDRMKIAVPLIVVIAATIVLWRSWLAVAAVVIVTIVANVGIYGALAQRDTGWVADQELNQRLMGAVEHRMEDCSVLGADGKVRGYLNLLVGRDIHEYQSPESIARLIADYGAECGILFETSHPRVDLPVLQRILVLLPDGSVEMEVTP